MILFLELPTTVTNQYCSGQKFMKFLKNEHIRCYVKIKDLHMLHILELASKTNVISPMQETNNNTALVIMVNGPFFIISVNKRM